MSTSTDYTGCTACCGGSSCSCLCAGLPSTLHATIANLSGCACADLTTITLTQDGTNPCRWLASSNSDFSGADTCNFLFTDAAFTCAATCGAMGFDIGTTPDVNSSGPRVTVTGAISCSCSPLDITFNVPVDVQDGSGDCSGIIQVTIHS